MVASKASRSILSPSRGATSQENSVEDKVDKVVDIESDEEKDAPNFWWSLRGKSAKKAKIINHHTFTDIKIKKSYL